MVRRIPANPAQPQAREASEREKIRRTPVRKLQAILAIPWDSSIIFSPRYPQRQSTISCGYKTVAIYALTNLSCRPTVFLMLRRRLDRG